ncbi:MAG: hypothetical protein AMS24_03980 [Chlamydiae bacterium SM23_39]|nr:MAG: hypothetical protein AMS24_03980 [Chlamydiae bacterium SM23_39]
MPYNDISDLPKPIKSHLPKKAQIIFLKAFNNAFEKYSEEIAFKIAWSAVKKSYHKDEEGHWVKNFKENKKK